VNGPEILNKFVGASEENIRALFKDAEEEQAEMGDDSELHIIIFDELDAICKSRGSDRGGTGVGDSVVNQLLSKIDGVDSLNNILIIGMTNRKDMMDEALLRPGRFEVHVEIGLPNERGRLQILNIHTKKMRDNEFLGQDIISDIDFAKADSALAKATKNYSGAEIAGLIRNAASQAFQRGVDPSKFSAADLANFKPMMTMADIQQALSETKPNFGVDDGELSAHFRNGIVHYGPAFDSLLGTLRQLVQQVRTSDKTPLLSVLLEGPSQSGKTALAAKIAAESEFPFVRMLSADKLIGFSEGAKCNHVFKMFQDSWKSPLSMIIIDDIERCLDYTPIGPRFSNQVLQAMLVLIKKNPPVEGRKLMVIGITSIPHLLEDMELTRVFNVSLHVPDLLEPEEIKTVLKETAPFSDADLERIADHIKEPIGVKKLLMVTEMARQDGVEAVTAENFLACLSNCGL
jgi:vesicle-fusing ATPase